MVREVVKPQTPKSCLRLCSLVLVGRHPSSASALPLRVPPPTSPAQPVLRTVPRDGSKRPRPIKVPPLPQSLAVLSPGPLGLALTSSCRAPPGGATRRPGRARSSGSAAGSRERPSFRQKDPKAAAPPEIPAAGSARSLPARRRAGHAGSAPAARARAGRPGNRASALGTGLPAQRTVAGGRPRRRLAVWPRPVGPAVSNFQRE